jgi:hypothetical protein
LLGTASAKLSIAISLSSLPDWGGAREIRVANHFRSEWVNSKSD